MAEDQELLETMLEAQRRLENDTQSQADETQSGQSTPTRRRRTLPSIPVAVPPQTVYRYPDPMTREENDQFHTPARAFSPVIPHPVGLFSNVNHEIDDRHRNFLEDREIKSKEPGSDKEISMRPKIKPRDYNGTSPWEEYWLHFRQVAMLNNWSEATSRQFLLVNLNGAALEFAFTLAESTRCSFQRLTEALSKRFGAAKEAMVHQAALDNIYRRPGQTIPALGQEIRRKVRLAYPSVDMEAQEALTISYFRRAITDPTQRMFICSSEPKTLDKAMEAALRAEAYESVEEGRGRPQKIRSIDRSGSPHNIKEDQLENIINRLERLEANGQSVKPKKGPKQPKHVRDGQQPTDNHINSVEERLKKLEEESLKGREKRDVVCYSCNQPGHTSRTCPRAVANQPSNTEGNLVCQRCHKFGHTANNCRTRILPPQPGTRNCFRCGQPGHFARNCSIPGNTGHSPDVPTSPRKAPEPPSRNNNGQGPIGGLRGPPQPPFAAPVYHSNIIGAEPIRMGNVADACKSDFQVYHSNMIRAERITGKADKSKTSVASGIGSKCLSIESDSEEIDLEHGTSVISSRPVPGILRGNDWVNDDLPVRTTETVVIAPKGEAMVFVQTAQPTPFQNAVIIPDRRLISKFGIIPHPGDIIQTWKRIAVQLINPLNQSVEIQADTTVGFLYRFDDLEQPCHESLPQQDVVPEPSNNPAANIRQVFVEEKKPHENVDEVRETSVEKPCPFHKSLSVEQQMNTPSSFIKATGLKRHLWLLAILMMLVCPLPLLEASGIQQYQSSDMHTPNHCLKSLMYSPLQLYPDPNADLNKPKHAAVLVGCVPTMCVGDCPRRQNKQSFLCTETLILGECMNNETITVADEDESNCVDIQCFRKIKRPKPVMWMIGQTQLVLDFMFNEINGVKVSLTF